MTAVTVCIVIGATAVVEGVLALAVALQVRRDMRRRDAERSGQAEIARRAIQMFQAYRSVNDPLGSEDTAADAVVEMFEYIDDLERKTP